MARIVETDNYGSDYPDERFLLWPMAADKAQKIVDAINEAAGPGFLRYWKVVSNEYELQPGFEP